MLGTVLVLDDLEALRTLVAEDLEEFGYEVLSVATVAEAKSLSI